MILVIVAVIIGLFSVFSGFEVIVPFKQVKGCGFS